MVRLEKHFQFLLLQPWASKYRNLLARILHQLAHYHFTAYTRTAYGHAIVNTLFTLNCFLHRTRPTTKFSSCVKETIVILLLLTFYFSSRLGQGHSGYYQLSFSLTVVLGDPLLARVNCKGSQSYLQKNKDVHSCMFSISAPTGNTPSGT